MQPENLYWVPAPNPKRQPTQAVMQDRCVAWNRVNPVGTPIEYLPTRGDRAGLRRTKTRSAAYVMSGHSPVLFIEGVAGCVHLDHVRAISGGSDAAA